MAELGNLTDLTLLWLHSTTKAGSLPALLTNLRHFDQLLFNINAGLRAPSTAVFQNWLGGIRTVRGPTCSPRRPSGAGVIGAGTGLIGAAREPMRQGARSGSRWHCHYSGRRGRKDWCEDGSNSQLIVNPIRYWRHGNGSRQSRPLRSKKQRRKGPASSVGRAKPGRDGAGTTRGLWLDAQ